MQNKLRETIAKVKKQVERVAAHALGSVGRVVASAR